MDKRKKMVLDNVRMPKLQEIFTTVTCMWCHNVTRDSQFCKIFLRLFSFEQAKVLKNLSEKLYTSKIKKKKSVGCPHLVPGNRCLSTFTKKCCAHTLSTRYVVVYFALSDAILKYDLSSEHKAVECPRTVCIQGPGSHRYATG